MSNFLTLWRRELTACFLSPVAYVALVVFPAVADGTFFIAVLKNAGTFEPLTSLLAAAVVLWLPLLVTVVCMRLFAEEKRSGTIEMLMTAPVTETEVVMGKYAGALTFVLLVLIPTLGAVLLLARLSPGITLADVDPGALAGSTLILGLLTAFLVAIGLVVSLLTRNQIVSAICSFAAISVTLMCGWLLSMLPGVGRSLVEYLSATEHIESFAIGTVDARPAVLYATCTAFLLFVAVRLLEARRWR
jgi:ABC-2 type transport system permease protein